MDDDIVRIPLEREMLPLLQHPQIERVVQKQVCQQWANDTALRSATFPRRQVALFILCRRFQPALDVEDDPFILRVFPNCLHQQVMVDVVEKALDIQVADPVKGPASLPGPTHRIQRRLPWPIAEGVGVEQWIHQWL